jgi:organic radical activating enzyme
MILQVKSIFATIQGEGPNVGTPAVFIRLGGCNLACEFCDTSFEDYTSMPLKEIIEKVDTLADKTIKLIVITGGEPTRQPIEALTIKLIEADYKVQIETNGMLYRDLPEEVEIICSPKVSNGEYHPIRHDVLSRVDALKFIISQHVNGYQTVGDVGQSEHSIPIYIQPMDEFDDAINKSNCDYCVHLAKEHGYKLSLQTHKILDID